MINLILILITAVLAYTTWIVSTQRGVREYKRQREARFGKYSAGGCSSCNEKLTHIGDSNEDELADEDAQTIELIGRKAYNEMHKRIRKLLARHSGQNCIFLPLTCGANTDKGNKEMHNILPGEAVSLCRNREDGVDCYDVYSRGVRIGRLALLDAQTLSAAMQNYYIRGAYVAQQNCYQIEGCNRVGLIFFLEPIESSGTVVTDMLHPTELPENDLKGNFETGICSN